MKVKLFTSLSGTAYHLEGPVLDVDDGTANRLIQGNMAVSAETTSSTENTDTKTALMAEFTTLTPAQAAEVEQAVHEIKAKTSASPKSSTSAHVPVGWKS
jgi:phosphoribosylformimino-5-aminoimidazole carboxamide ribonucleotide (ProFAR) isomerase